MPSIIDVSNNDNTALKPSSASSSNDAEQLEYTTSRKLHLASSIVVSDNNQRTEIIDSSVGVIVVVGKEMMGLRR